jgi:hypothetical protein
MAAAFLPGRRVDECQQAWPAAVPAERVSRAAHAGATGHGDLRAARDRRDATRLAEFYDGTFEYLAELGLPLA